MKPNCYNCKFKKNIPGNCHISCGLPVFNKMKEDPMIGLLSLSSAPISTGLEKYLGLTANQHGVKNGWCFFPFNYDPVWLTGDCSQYQEEMEK